VPPGKTDADYVLGLLRSKGILCVYGSGFGTAPEDGFFRIVFLAALHELDAIYDDVDEFTRTFRSA
jgi:aspartate/methionine/tyrosine aminotransferase